MELARSCRYAVQGVAYLAQRTRPGEPVLLRDVAAAIGAPEAFLSKIFQNLRGAGILRSHRGTTRGYALARDPASITLYDVVLATEGRASLHSSEFLVGDEEARFANVWREVEDLVASRLRATSIRELASRPAESEKS